MLGVMSTRASETPMEMPMPTLMPVASASPSISDVAAMRTSLTASMSAFGPRKADIVGFTVTVALLTPTPTMPPATACARAEPSAYDSLATPTSLPALTVALPT